MFVLVFLIFYKKTSITPTKTAQLEFEYLLHTIDVNKILLGTAGKPRLEGACPDLTATCGRLHLFK